ncbi:MAG: alanine--tRNA ligase, partial [Acidimicrobiaceae bacterium]|nr:alanine--tRNA ligase [Acidimicrobiaceae bacterium]
TYGFPLEVTVEIAAERGVEVDTEGFAAAMSQQQERGRSARSVAAAADVAPFVALFSAAGPTEFTGRAELASVGRVLYAADGRAVLDRTPFYAESGGQIGDTGDISCEATGARVRVVDTVYGVPDLHVHVVEPVDGELRVGDEVTATVDAERRAGIRRNHTATHILHWALREVLGDHVKQQGSWVGPDRLRFDFSHYEALTAEQITDVEDLVNSEVLGNESCRHYETTFDHAQQVGAIAFFGEKYGELVRVLEAGRHSVELCGGTHVRALGDIGAFHITSEASIGANMRRLEAITGHDTLALLRSQQSLIDGVARSLGVPAAELADGVAKRQGETKALRAEVAELRRRVALGRAPELAAAAVDGVVVARVDDVGRDGLRDLAASIRDIDGVKAVVLGAALDSGGAALAAAATEGGGFHAGDLIGEAKQTIGGGGKPAADLCVAGGRDADRLDEALDLARSAAGIT